MPKTTKKRTKTYLIKVIVVAWVSTIPYNHGQIYKALSALCMKPNVHHLTLVTIFHQYMLHICHYTHNKTSSNCYYVKYTMANKHMQ